MQPAHAIADTLTKKRLFIRPTEIADPNSLIPFAAPWVLEAGNPYFNWLFGNAALAQTEIEKWMARESSEISIHRVEFLLSGSDVAGGYIAMNGRELRAARLADTETLWRSIDRSGRAALMERLETSASLFPPVAEDEFYGSKMGLLHSHRNKGLALALVQRFLDQGRTQGYTHFRLDVQAQNRAAIRCYLAMGFEAFETSQTPDGSLQYVSMRLSTHS